MPCVLLRLLTLCSVNPAAWKLLATEGYRLSKPVNAKITDLLCIDDLRVALKDIGLHGKKKKVRGNTCQSLRDRSYYKFLGVLEDIRQEVSLVLENVRNVF